jgi:hypothetical protein
LRPAWRENCLRPAWRTLLNENAFQIDIRKPLAVSSRKGCWGLPLGKLIRFRPSRYQHSPVYLT